MCTACAWHVGIPRVGSRADRSRRARWRFACRSRAPEECSEGYCVARGICTTIARHVSALLNTAEAARAVGHAVRTGSAVYEREMLCKRGSSREGRRSNLEDPLVKLSDCDAGAAERRNTGRTVLEAVANPGAPLLLHRLELPLHLYAANNKWLVLLCARLSDERWRSEWARRRLGTGAWRWRRC